MDNYLKNTPETICGSPLFRNRSRAAYSKDTLGDDFRAVRAKIFQATRACLWMLVAPARPEHLPAARAQSKSARRWPIPSPPTRERTYLPVNSAVIRMVDRARLDGRTAIQGTKV